VEVQRRSPSDERVPEAAIKLGDKLQQHHPKQVR